MHMSEAFPHLSKAPIIEAVIDFRAALAPTFNVEKLQEAHPTIRQDYPQMKTQRSWMGQMMQAAGKPPKQAIRDLGITGYEFSSADGKYVAQFRRDGFSFSRLAPYTSWEDVFSRAATLWKAFCEFAQPIEVTRIAVRTINRILLPLPVTDLSKYLTAPPSVAPGTPNELLDFLTQVFVIDRATNIVSNIIQTVEQGPRETYVPIILDTDVYLERPFQPADAALLKQFDALRHMKNLIFFRSLVPEIIETFK
jgi:uncharacterized protein (TIGR04255 family)